MGGACRSRALTRIPPSVHACRRRGGVQCLLLPEHPPIHILHSIHFPRFPSSLPILHSIHITHRCTHACLQAAGCSAHVRADAAAA